MLIFLKDMILRLILFISWHSFSYPEFVWYPGSKALPPPKNNPKQSLRSNQNLAFGRMHTFANSQRTENYVLVKVYILVDKLKTSTTPKLHEETVAALHLLNVNYSQINVISEDKMISTLFILTCC